MGVLFGWLFLIGIVYLGIFWKPKTSTTIKTENHKNQLSYDAGTKAVQDALRNTESSINSVSSVFEELQHLRNSHKDIVELNFFLLETAIIVIKEQINNKISISDFSNEIFNAGKNYSNDRIWFNLLFSDSGKSIFFEVVNVYLQSTLSFIESSNSPNNDYGPGGLLLIKTLDAIKQPEQLTDGEIQKCLDIGLLLSSSILQHIFDKKKHIPNENSDEKLSQRLDDAAEKCGVELDEFINRYIAYLETLQGDGDWNTDIDQNAIKMNILTEDEVKSAKINIKQAALNRTIYRYEYFKKDPSES